MGAGHAHPLHLPGDSAAHRLPPHVKIAAAVAGVLAIVATPREALWAFGAHLAVLAVVWTSARVPLRWILPRATIELPFVVLVVLLPFAGEGPRTEVLGVSLSIAGLHGAWNILAKGTLGVLLSLTLAATTPLHDLVAGLHRLRAPAVVVMIATLMLRYLDVIAGEARRMRLARVARGHDPRLLTQAGATARGVGALFVRSYERGERVHLAMLARGWRGVMPARGRAATAAEWVAGLTPAVVLVAIAALAWWSR